LLGCDPGELISTGLARLAAKHSIHQTMIVTQKKQAVDGMATAYSGKARAD